MRVYRHDKRIFFQRQRPSSRWSAHCSLSPTTAHLAVQRDLSSTMLRRRRRDEHGRTRRRCSPKGPRDHPRSAGASCKAARRREISRAAGLATHTPEGTSRSWLEEPAVRHGEGAAPGAGWRVGPHVGTSHPCASGLAAPSFWSRSREGTRVRLRHRMRCERAVNSEGVWCE